MDLFKVDNRKMFKKKETLNQTISEKRENTENSNNVHSDLKLTLRLVCFYFVYFILDFCFVFVHFLALEIQTQQISLTEDALFSILKFKILCKIPFEQKKSKNASRRYMVIQLQL